jgi:prepilin-type processing-associated H-X9-DG protein
MATSKISISIARCLQSWSLFSKSRLGRSRIELTALLGCLCLLTAVFLPRLVSLREVARKHSCQRNLTRLGTALDTYHNRHLSFPPGYFPSDRKMNSDGSMNWWPNVPSYAWSAFLLCELGYEDLHAALDVRRADLQRSMERSTNKDLLQTIIPDMRCASDRFGRQTELTRLRSFQESLVRGPYHSIGAATSYVASGGYFELKHPYYLAPPGQWIKQVESQTGPNNGVFHVASNLHRRQIVDGLANTFLLGERAWYQGGSNWVGTGNINGVGPDDAGVCLARVWWRINQLPRSAVPAIVEHSTDAVTHEYRLNADLNNSPRDAFGSYHPNGANFLMADGSVRFIDDQIDSKNTIPLSGANPVDPIPQSEQLGLFQKLGIRNDSLTHASSGDVKL